MTRENRTSSSGTPGPNVAAGVGDGVSRRDITVSAAQDPLTTHARSLNRRAIMRVLVGGGAGLALATAGPIRRVVPILAGEETPTAAPDPVADPEAGEPTVSSGGSPVGSAGKVVVYSGRNEDLVGPVIGRFESATGIDAEVRYANTGELTATILEEGDNSPASLFFGQDAGALGALAREDRLAALPDDLLERVDARFRSPDGVWIGVSGRARVAVYNTDLIQPDELPASVLDLTDERWRGKIGWAPENASFKSFVTALRVVKGEDTARAWLEGMIANEPENFGDSNGAVTRAVGAGELPVGLVNHYYLYEVQKEDGVTLPLANHFFAAGDPGSLINVAAVGILKDAPDADRALAFLEYLLTPEAQTYFAEETYEYPLIEGIAALGELPPLTELESPDIDLTDLADLEGTLNLLAEVGLI